MCGEGFDHFDNFVLLASGEGGDLIKDAPEFSRRPAASSAFFGFAKEVFSGDVQHPDQGLNLFGAKGYGVTFPIGIGRLGESQLRGDFGL